MGEWIEHKGDGCPVPKGTVVFVRYRSGEVEGPFGAFTRNPDSCPETAVFSRWHWSIPENIIADEWHVIAYRLHDDSQSEAETRKARMADFYKIAAGKDHLIEETLKTRKPVSAPQKAGE